MDDFVRNFLVKMGMTSTLEKFEAGDDLEATGRLGMEGILIPACHNTNQELNGTVMSLSLEAPERQAGGTLQRPSPRGTSFCGH